MSREQTVLVFAEDLRNEECRRGRMPFVTISYLFVLSLEIVYCLLALEIFGEIPDFRK
jgi:hypothetical protein